MCLHNMSSIVASFTAGFMTVVLLKWSLSNVRNLLKHTSCIGKMKMALVVRSDLGRDSEKLASQCAQAAISCYKRSLQEDPGGLDIWIAAGQPKIVLKPNENGEEILIQLVKKSESLGLINCVIRNEANSVTAIGIGPGKIDDIDKILGHLKLL